MKSVGINGFGRFGLHLLKYWIERFYNSGFIIKYINDENLNIVRIFEILNSDQYCKINQVKLFIEKKGVLLKFPGV